MAWSNDLRRRFHAGGRAMRRCGRTLQDEPASRGIKAVRQGELDIKPPVNRPLATREVVFKRLLGKRFGKIFPPEMVSKGVELPGAWAKAGTLIASQAQADDGWLLVTWEEGGKRSRQWSSTVSQRPSLRSTNDGRE